MFRISFRISLCQAADTTTVFRVEPGLRAASVPLGRPATQRQVHATVYVFLNEFAFVALYGIMIYNNND